MKRIPMGPRPDQYVPVRAAPHDDDRRRGGAAEQGVPSRRRVIQRWAGPHYIGPVWVSEREVAGDR